MNANLSFQKALHQLDRGMLQNATETLEQTILLAKDENDLVTLAGALCCLGDFLVQTGEADHARKVLEELLALPVEGDLFDFELNRGKQLLAQISKAG